MRAFVSTLTISLILTACGSTTVTDGGPTDDITADSADADAGAQTGDAGDASDVAPGDVPDADAGAAPDTALDTTADGDPCQEAGCPCVTTDDCSDSLVCAESLCCAPSCDGKACGDDGCGGSCGACDGELPCNDLGQCMICTPNASECDGNSTTTCDALGTGYAGTPFDCGSLPETPVCVDGACVCVPSCDGKACGDDGCGGSCGDCTDGEICDADQLCQEWVCEATASYCDGDVAFVCNDDGTGPDPLIGGVNCAALDMSCDEGVCVCVPDCAGKNCGDDGCGGDCGTCEGGSTCVEGVCNYDGDTCEAPILLDVSEPINLFNQWSDTYNDDYDNGCGGDGPVEMGPSLPGKGGQGAGAPDVVYEIELTEAGTLSVGFSTFSPEGDPDWEMLVYVWSYCPAMDVCAAYTMESIPLSSAVLDVPVAGPQTLFLVVDGTGPGEMGLYNLNIFFDGD